MTRAQLLPLLMVSLGSSVFTLAAGFVLAVLVLVPTAGAAPGSQVPSPVLRAERIELVDGGGTVRARLGVVEGAVALVLLDPSGQVRAGIGLEADQTASLVLQSGSNPGADLATVVLSARPDDSAHLRVGSRGGFSFTE